MVALAREHLVGSLQFQSSPIALTIGRLCVRVPLSEFLRGLVHPHHAGLLNLPSKNLEKKPATHGVTGSEF